MSRLRREQLNFLGSHALVWLLVACALSTGCGKTSTSVLPNGAWVVADVAASAKTLVPVFRDSSVFVTGEQARRLGSGQPVPIGPGDMTVRRTDEELVADLAAMLSANHCEFRADGEFLANPAVGPDLARGRWTRNGDAVVAVIDPSGPGSEAAKPLELEFRIRGDELYAELFGVDVRLKRVE